MSIHYYYITNKSKVFETIDDIYCKFDYPLEISGLVSYMPNEGGNYQDDKLDNYIKRVKDIWII